MDRKTNINFLLIILAVITLVIPSSIFGQSNIFFEESYSIQTITKSDWFGKYESDDKNPAISGDYQITVKQSGDQMVAVVYAEGTQLYDNFECRTQVVGDTLRLYLLRNLDGTQVYALGRPIRRGEFVGSLTTIRTRRGANKYLYKPGAYVIAFGTGRRQPPPAYFFKQK